MAVRLKIGCAVLGVFLLAIPLAHAAGSDTFEIIKRLKARNYPALETTLNQYQERYESDPRDEEALQTAYSIFESSDPTLKEPLDAWVRALPNSYAARLARGIYHVHLGGLTRGAAYIQDTTSDQIDGMRRHFALAQKDIHAAVAAHPKLSVGYRYLIRIYMNTGGRALSDLLDEALSSNPYSFCIHAQYMFSLTPKWGGSLSAMRSYADRLKTLAPQNPRLIVLAGYIPYAQADELERRGNYEDALKKYNNAIEYGEYGSFFAARGRFYYYQDDYTNALADFSKSLSLRPIDADTLAYRGKTYYYLRRYREALADLNQAIRLDPLDPDSLVARSQIYGRLGMPWEVEKDLENALIYGKYSTNVWRNRGWFHYYGERNFGQAAIDLARAIKLGARDSQTLQLLGWSLMNILFKFIYIVSAAVIGVAGGLLVRHSRKPQIQGQTYRKGWTAYALGIVVVLGLVLLIGKLEQLQLWNESLRWVALAVLAICFLAVFATKPRAKKVAVAANLGQKGPN